MDNENRAVRKKNLDRSRAEVQGLVTGFTVGWLIGSFFVLLVVAFGLPVEIVIVLVVFANFLVNFMAMRMSAIDRSDRDLQ